jgi:hypothetical protein
LTKLAGPLPGAGFFIPEINTLMTAKIILIADLIEEKLRKERELEFYEDELKRLLTKMNWVRQEISLTETIIKLIQKEEIPNLLKSIEDKR